MMYSNIGLSFCETVPLIPIFESPFYRTKAIHKRPCLKIILHFSPQWFGDYFINQSFNLCFVICYAQCFCTKQYVSQSFYLFCQFSVCYPHFTFVCISEMSGREKGHVWARTGAMGPNISGDSFRLLCTGC